MATDQTSSAGGGESVLGTFPPVLLLPPGTFSLGSEKELRILRAYWIEMFSLVLAMAPQAQQWFSDHPQFPRLTGEALRSIKPKYHKGGPKKRKRGQSD